VEPVVFLIPSVSVLVSVVAVGQELQASPPINWAATISRSFDVHEVLAGGKACPYVILILSKLNIKKAYNFFVIVDFDFIQLVLVE
jgi:hypothetical protein